MNNITAVMTGRVVKTDLFVPSLLPGHVYDRCFKTLRPHCLPAANKSPEGTPDVCATTSSEFYAGQNLFTRFFLLGT